MPVRRQVIRAVYRATRRMPLPTTVRVLSDMPCRLIQGRQVRADRRSIGTIAIRVAVAAQYSTGGAERLLRHGGSDS